MATRLSLPTADITSELFVIKELQDRLYKLTYIYSNQTTFRFIFIEDKLPMGEIVSICKDYCVRSNFRFVYVEQAITTLTPLDE